jgi:predicted transcriptional regulator
MLGGVTPEQDERRVRARRLHGEGKTFADIARELRVSVTTARKYCKGLGLPDNNDSRRGRAEAARNQNSNELVQLPERERAFDMIISGMSPLVAARTLGRDPRTVRRWIDEEIEERISPRVEKLRSMGNARLDSLRAVAWTIAHDAANAAKLRLEAIDRVLHIERRWAALNGVDSPVRVEAVYTEKTQQDLEIEELIREAQARNQIIEGQIVDDADTAPE